MILISAAADDGGKFRDQVPIKTIRHAKRKLMLTFVSIYVPTRDIFALGLAGQDGCMVGVVSFKACIRD